MTNNNEDVQKLIEAARISVQEGKEFRTSALQNKTVEEVEAQIKEQRKEELNHEWSQWENQIKEQEDQGKNSKSGLMTTIYTLAAIIFALGLLAVFHINFTKQQAKMSQKPRLNINKLTTKKPAVIKTDETKTGKKGDIAVHNGVPSAQAPSWYKPEKRSALREKRKKILREKLKNRMKTKNTAPGSNTVTDAKSSGLKPKVSGENESEIPKPGTKEDNEKFVPTWMKENAPPKTTPGGAPIFIQ